jgi:chromosome partitioning protein
MIIGIVNVKGGVGKTTTAIHLATAIAAAGTAVIVLDADDQHSSLAWSTNATARGTSLPFRVQAVEFRDLQDTAQNCEKAGNVVVIDSPPNLKDINMAVAAVSSVVVLPVSPSGVELDRLVETLAIVRLVEKMRGSLPVGVLLTKYDRREKIAREASEALERYPIFDTRVRSLTRYKSFGEVPDYLEEYDALWQELKELDHG